jgi:hypothetical protein
VHSGSADLSQPAWRTVAAGRCLGRHAPDLTGAGTPGNFPEDISVTSLIRVDRLVRVAGGAPAGP